MKVGAREEPSKETERNSDHVIFIDDKGFNENETPLPRTMSVIDFQIKYLRGYLSALEKEKTLMEIKTTVSVEEILQFQRDFLEKRN